MPIDTDQADRNYRIEKSCCICGEPSAIWYPVTGDREEIDCPKCGKMRVSGSVLPDIERGCIPDANRAWLSPLLKRLNYQRDADGWLLIDGDLLGSVNRDPAIVKSSAKPIGVMVGGGPDREEKFDNLSLALRAVETRWGGPVVIFSIATQQGVPLYDHAQLSDEVERRRLATKHAKPAH